MATQYHDLQTVGSIHIPNDLEYATQTARKGDTDLEARHVGRLAKQTDDGSFWRLVDTTPTWAPFTPPPAVVGDIGKALTAATDGDSGVKLAWAAPAPAAHAATHKTAGSDPIKLDEFATPDDNTNLNATASYHGLLPKLSGAATDFLDGSGAWSVPSDLTTAGNKGGANGWYKSKVGNELGFYTFQAGSTKLNISGPTADVYSIDVAEANIVHQNLSGAGSNTHAQIDSHIAATANPHATTLDLAYDGGASTVTVDKSDVLWTLSGAYSFVVDVAGATGTGDGFSVLNGTDSFKINRTGADTLDVLYTVDNYGVTAAGVFTVGATGAVTMASVSDGVRIGTGAGYYTTIGASADASKLTTPVNGDLYVRNRLEVKNEAHLRGDTYWYNGPGTDLARLTNSSDDLLMEFVDDGTADGKFGKFRLYYLYNEDNSDQVIFWNTHQGSAQLVRIEVTASDTELIARGTCALKTIVKSHAAGLVSGDYIYAQDVLVYGDGDDVAGASLTGINIRNGNTSGSAVRYGVRIDDANFAYGLYTKSPICLSGGTSIVSDANADITIAPNGTGDVIFSVGGTERARINDAGLVKIGTGTPGNSPVSLYVTDTAEFDGICDFDGRLDINAGANVAANQRLQFNASASLQYHTSNNSLQIMPDDTSRTLIVCEVADRATAFGIANQTDPTIALQASDAANVYKGALLAWDHLTCREVAGVARQFTFDMPVGAGGAAAAALDWQTKIDGTFLWGLIAETDGAGSYREPVAIIPNYSDDYGVGWASPPNPTPASLQNGGHFVAHNTNDDTYRAYYYTNGGWRYASLT